MSKPNISFFYPVYRDENTIVPITRRAMQVLSDVANEFEIVIVDDGSPDRSGAIADDLARQFPQVSVVHHPVNQGYGKAIRTGFATASRYEWICFTDGDFQYDPAELYQIVKRLPSYDVIIGFRLRKVYGPLRKLMSAALNTTVSRVFGTRYRDITCGFKMLRRCVLDEIELESESGFVGAELLLRASMKGFRVGEIAISMYEREFGDSAAISFRNISSTLKDILRVRAALCQNRPRMPLPPRPDQFQSGSACALEHAESMS